MTSSGPPSCAIGVDVGGTKCAAGLVVLPEGRVVGRRQLPTNAQRGGAAVLAEVVELARALVDEGARAGLTPRAVGVGVAELVGPDGSVLSNATIAWQGLDVAGEIRAAVGLPVRLEADVRAAARAEAQLGAGRGRGSFLYVTVGTGISASLVLEGAPYAGARGLTGTCASSGNLVPGDDASLATGPPLEQFSAGPALAARFAAAGGDPLATPQDIVARCEAGEAIAQSIVVTAGEALGAAIGQLVNMLDPEIVVIGGGLGLVGGAYREAIERAMRRHIWSDLHRDVPLVSAHHGEDAGIIGAALAANDC
jgi:glucokinase